MTAGCGEESSRMKQENQDIDSFGSDVDAWLKADVFSESLSFR